MNKNFVYILECADNSYYTGYTNNLERRLAAHNSKNGAKYTRSRLPVKYVFTYECPDKSTALRLEYRIKQLSRKEKKEIIRGNKKVENLLIST